MTELDAEHFCSGGVAPNCIEECSKYTPCILCGHRHTKWPTPEQFEREYGVSLKGMPCYIRGGSYDVWTLTEYDPGYHKDWCKVVIACTPYGKPDKDWRPKND